MRFFIFGPSLFGGLFRPGLVLGGNSGVASPPVSPASQDYVYVIAGEHGLTKVGVSNDPAARLATLQTGSPFRLRLVHMAAAGNYAYQIEQEAHSILENRRQNLEWFNVSPEIATAALYGAADRLRLPLPAALANAASGFRMSPLAMAALTFAAGVTVIYTISAIYNALN